MERYESRPINIPRPVGEIYEKFSRLDFLTPYASDKVEDWKADADTVSFRAAGFPVSLKVAERVPDRMIRVVSEQGASPIPFAVVMNFEPAAGGEGTLLKITMEMELNMMMKMMVGSRIQQGLDAVADAVEKAV